MQGQSLLSVGLILVVTGSLLASISGFLVGRRAFRISLLWGVACLIVPGITLIFPFFAWRQCRGLLFMQLVGMAVILAGVAVVLLDPGTRSGIKAAMDERAQVAELMDYGEPDGVRTAPSHSDITRIFQDLGLLPIAEPKPKQSTKPVSIPAKPPETPVAATDAENCLRAMYTRLQVRSSELQKKRPGPDAKPEEVRAFNKEYGDYQTLLDQYKALRQKMVLPHQ